jgi:hypothetical protein
MSQMQKHGEIKSNDNFEIKNIEIKISAMFP